jgi:hypothetical protein
MPTGTEAQVPAVIDDLGRRTLSFRVAGRFEIGSTTAVLVEGARGSRWGLSECEHVTSRILWESPGCWR